MAEGCVIGCFLAVILAVPIAIMVAISQGSAKRKGWQMVRGEKPATIAEIDACVKSIGDLQDAEAIELVRRLTALRDQIAK